MSVSIVAIVPCDSPSARALIADPARLGTEAEQTTILPILLYLQVDAQELMMSLLDPVVPMPPAELDSCPPSEPLGRSPYSRE